MGREFGTTTGRRRRCGWLDLVVLKHSLLINGYDALNVTKLDVLDGLAEIKVAVKYLVDGKELAGFPGTHGCFGCYFLLILMDTVAADLDVLAKVEVEYVTLAGWGTSIAATREFEALPENCQKYVSFIEEFLGVPVEWIGVGPGRESMITKRI